MLTKTRRRLQKRTLTAMRARAFAAAAASVFRSSMPLGRGRERCRFVDQNPLRSIGEMQPSLAVNAYECCPAFGQTLSQKCC